MKGTKILAILVVGVMSVSLLARVEVPDKVPPAFKAIWDALVDLQGQTDDEIADRTADVDEEEAARIAGDDALQNLLEAAIASGDTATADAAQAANDALQSALEAAIASGDTATADAAQAANDALQSALEAAIVSGDTATANAAQAANDALQNLLEAAIASGDTATADAAQVANDALQSALEAAVAAEESTRAAADGALQEQIDDIQPIPAGVIVMWSGEIGDIPDGWALCDGSDDTPDLTDKFICGSDGGDLGTTGGSSTYSLTVSQLPGHTHTGVAMPAGAHAHPITLGAGTGSSLRPWALFSDPGNTYDYGTGVSQYFSSPPPKQEHTHRLVIDSTGGGSSIDNRPDYYKLAFIMKL